MLFCNSSYCAFIDVLIETSQQIAIADVPYSLSCNFLFFNLCREFDAKFNHGLEEERVTLVGNYWDRKGQNEIDMIALNDIDKTAVVAEIKRQRKKFSPTELAEKTAALNKELSKYSVSQIGLSMEDM